MTALYRRIVISLVMICAFTFITLHPKFDSSVCMNEIKKLVNVKEVHELYGIYDILAIIEVESTTHLKEVIFEKIRKMEFVETTIDLISMDNNGKNQFVINQEHHLVTV